MIYHIVIVFLLSIQLYCKIIIPIDNEIKGKILSIDTNTSISIQFSSLLSKTFLSSFINKTDLPIYKEIHNSTFTFDEPNLFTNSSFTFDLSYYVLINENVSSFKYGSISDHISRSCFCPAISNTTSSPSLLSLLKAFTKTA